MRHSIAHVSRKPGSEWVEIWVMDLDEGLHFIDVKETDLLNFIEHDALIQDAFPYLDVEQRELILTGMTQEMWDQATLNEEEE
jgi:hypothetical protein